MKPEILAPISVVLALFLVQPLTVLIHELGHGLTALLLEKGPVTLYIGSYGDPDKSLVINIKRLKVFFKYQVFYWRSGVCYHTPDTKKFFRNFAVTLMGPVTSLLVAALATYMYFGLETHGSIKAIALFFMLSCTSDFFRNIRPNPNPIKLWDGSITYNDGMSLKNLLRYRRFSSAIDAAVKLYEREEHEKALTAYQKIIEKGGTYPELFRMVIYLKQKLKLQDGQIETYAQLEAVAQLQPLELVNLGVLLAIQGQINEAMDRFQQSVDLDPDFGYGLQNRGYVHGLREEFELSLTDFSAAKEKDGLLSYCLSGMGLAKIMLGREDEGLADLAEALREDAQEAYAFKNLGIYYFHKGSLNLARKHFEQALTINPDTHGVNGYLPQIENGWNALKNAD